MKRSKALLIGSGIDLIAPLLTLFNKIGFEIDVIFSNNPAIKKSRFIDNLEILEGHEVIKNLSCRDLEIYDIIAPCDDETLKLIIDSDLSIERKLKILPVTNIKGFEHIFSKIGLSKILSESEVSTPSFLIANGILEAKEAAKNLGYPVMIKIDSSSGGIGVFECQSAADIDSIEDSFFDKLTLVQKKIIGTELDLSAFYRDEKLIFFSYSKIQKVVSNKFGPSVVRLYKQLGAIDTEIFLEMKKLGKALNADGFVTISCIETIDKKRYFIEADMRPNVWVKFPKFFGDDPAIRVANWFVKKEIFSQPQINNKYPTEIILPYFNRMSATEILFNRYKVWKYLPYRDSKLLFFLLAIKFKFLTKNFFNKIKRLPTTTIRLVIPKKEDRIKIRDNIKKLKLYFTIATRISS